MTSCCSCAFLSFAANSALILRVAIGLRSRVREGLVQFGFELGCVQIDESLRSILLKRHSPPTHDADHAGEVAQLQNPHRRAVDEMSWRWRGRRRDDATSEGAA